MSEHTPITERDGISAVRRHLRDEHGVRINYAYPADWLRSQHRRIHDAEMGPQNPPMPDEPKFDAEASYVRWAEQNPGEAEQAEYDKFEARRDREDSDA
jgi:hypothetical protein